MAKYRYEGQEYIDRDELLKILGAEFLPEDEEFYDRWVRGSETYDTADELLADAGVEQLYSITADITVYIGGVTREAWASPAADEDSLHSTLIDAVGALDEADLVNAQWGSKDLYNVSGEPV